MRMLSLKSLIGLGAIGGAVYYARKNGGFKNVFNQIVGKARQAKDEVIGKAHEATQSYSSNRSMPEDPGYGTGIGGSGVRH
jgi:hypothetical protein